MFTKYFAIIILTFAVINSSEARFASGSYDNNALLINNVLYVSGNNAYHRLFPIDEPYFSKFVKFANDVKDFSLSGGRISYLTNSGELYYSGWRTNTADVVNYVLIDNEVTAVDNTELDIYYIKNGVVHKFTPKTGVIEVMQIPELVNSVNAGSNHIAAKSSISNKVYTFGLNNQGQLCNGNFDNVVAADIEVEGNNTYVLTNSGEVYGCGNNIYGQFGNVGSSVFTLTQIPNAVNVKSIKSTNSGLFLLHNDGTLSMIGWHNYIGANNSPYNMSRSIKYVPELNQIQEIGTGDSTIYIKDNYGTITGWGGNMSYMLGDLTNIERHGPVEITVDLEVEETGEVEICYHDNGNGKGKGNLKCNKVCTNPSLPCSNKK